MAALERDTTILTVEDYLKRERAGDQKHEFRQGLIYAMAGASRNHNLIVTAIVGSLDRQLTGRPCELYSADMRVRVASAGLYTYPDVVVACESPLFADEQQDTLLNPVVIMEVLSPTTERDDRGRKFQNYRTLDSLREYVLLAQDTRLVEHYTRQPDQTWLLQDFTEADASVSLTSIDCTLTLAEIYRKVRFEAAPDQNPDATFGESGNHL